MRIYILCILFLHLAFGKSVIQNEIENLQYQILNETITFDHTEYKVEDNVHFNLYTHRNPIYPYELKFENLKSSHFLSSNPTKFLTHGWTGSGNENWMIDMKNAYLNKHDHNVIIIDWKDYAQMEYTIAAGKTKKVGAYTGNLIIRLINELDLIPKDVHLVGHSLGGHVCGFAGKQVMLSVGKKVGRVTGLDPSGLLFEKPIMAGELDRLSKNDAEFVDVIHTCGGSMGFESPIGHADFFPNEGIATQNGCSLIGHLTCSHQRAYLYFTESIKSEDFKSVNCDTWKHYKKGKCYNNDIQSMGEPVSALARDKYFLKTNKKSPFATGSVK